MRTLMTSTSVMLALAGCADLGPFRAQGDDAQTDGGVASDGRTIDGAITDSGGGGGGEPMLLANAPARPTHLAVTAGYVYWAQLEDKKIGRAPTTGGSAQAIDGGGYGAGLIGRDTDVYWVAGNALRTASDAAFVAAAPLYTSSSTLYSTLAVSSTDVLFFEDGSGVDGEQLRTIERGGGSPQTARSPLVSPMALAVEASTLYVAAYGAIDQAPLANPTSTTVVASVSAGRLAVAGSRVCWTVRPDPNAYTIEVWCRAQGSDAVRIATAPQAVFALVVTSSHAYWIPQSNAATTKIQRYSFATGATSTVFTPETGWFATDLASDGTHLYWLETDDATGHVWRRSL